MGRGRKKKQEKARKVEGGIQREIERKPRA